MGHVPDGMLVVRGNQYPIWALLHRPVGEFKRQIPTLYLIDQDLAHLSGPARDARLQQQLALLCPAIPSSIIEQLTGVELVDLVHEATQLAKLRTAHAEMTGYIVDLKDNLNLLFPDDDDPQGEGHR